MARVLVVDDDPDILNLVRVKLRARGHQVLGAGSGMEALQVVEERGAPEVAVLDVSMPVMTGLELLQRLRGRDGLGELPAIFLSARVLPEDVEAGRALGATYLTKPFVTSALLDAVERLTTPPDGGW